MKKHDGAIAEETSTKNGGNFQEIVEIFRKGQLGRLFAGATENTLIQFFRYCFVGGAATIVDFAFHQSHAVIANGLSFVAGLLANYFLSTFWVFRSSKIKSRLAEFLAFAAIGVVGLLLTIGITKLFEITMADVTSAYQIISKVVSTAVAFLWNFFARKYLIYSKKDEA